MCAIGSVYYQCGHFCSDYVVRKCGACPQTGGLTCGYKGYLADKVHYNPFKCKDCDDEREEERVRNMRAKAHR